MTTTIEQIKARHEAKCYNYPVHVGCGGECEPRPDGTHKCAACDKILGITMVETRESFDRNAVDDVSYLLAYRSVAMAQLSNVRGEFMDRAICAGLAAGSSPAYALEKAKEAWRLRQSDSETWGDASS